MKNLSARTAARRNGRSRSGRQTGVSRQTINAIGKRRNTDPSLPLPSKWRACFKSSIEDIFSAD